MKKEMTVFIFRFFPFRELQTLISVSDLFVLQANIKYLHINSTTVYRFNTVKITSRIQNDGTARDKLIFKVALPNNAFITGFSM